MLSYDKLNAPVFEICVGLRLGDGVQAENTFDSFRLHLHHLQGLN